MREVRYTSTLASASGGRDGVRLHVRVSVQDLVGLAEHSRSSAACHVLLRRLA